MLTSPSEPPPVAAAYFDGHSARMHAVTLTLIDGGRLRVSGAEVARDEALSALRLSEPLGAAPRLITFADGAHCEVRDHAAFAALLEATGHVDSRIARWQQRWRAALVAALITMGALIAAYQWGLPAASAWIAFRVPEEMLTRLGGGALQLLDRTMLKPSALPAARQQALRQNFAGITVPQDIKARHDIVFRKGAGIGANALALPDGTIVVTDELVQLTGHDEEIMAVLAHELGHLNRRHGLRMLIQGSIVAFIVGWYLGDVSSVAAGLPTLLLQARYSRDHEREADRFAATMLRVNNISPRRLGDLLTKLEAAQRAAKTGNDGDRASSRGQARDYTASHPATAERIKALEQ